MKITDEMLREAAPGACELWLATLPADLPEHVFSARFERKMEKLLRHPYRRTVVRTLLIAALVTALLTMTAGAEVLQPAKTFRIGVVHVLSQVLPKSTDQIYTTDADHEGETKRPVLGWLPEGIVEVKRVELTNITRINYENTDGNRLSIYTKRIAKGETPSASIDTEDAHVEMISIHGNQAVVSIKDDTTIIEWCIDNYICSVIGTIPTDEVLKVAENMILE